MAKNDGNGLANPTIESGVDLKGPLYLFGIVQTKELYTPIKVLYKDGQITLAKVAAEDNYAIVSRKVMSWIEDDIEVNKGGRRRG